MNPGQLLFPQSRLLLSAGTLPGASFSERVAAAGEAGFDANSVFPQQYLAARSKEKLSVADMRALLFTHAVALARLPARDIAQQSMQAYQFCCTGAEEIRQRISRMSVREQDTQG